MADDPGQLGHDHAQVVGPLGHLDAHELLHRQRVAEVVGHRGEVVQPVGEGDVHEVGVALADLLVVAVQIAHHRLEVDDVSPSSVSTMRKTPWVLGCCGPMLTTMRSVFRSAAVAVPAWSTS